jgi:hypothetical protein
VPSSSAIAVAPHAAFKETSSASRAPWLSHALPNHSVVSPGIGHVWMRDSLNAYSTMIASGM